MGQETQDGRDTRRIAAAAVFTAFVFAATFAFSTVITITAGYFNFGEVMVYTAALVAGPYVGGFAGGVGSALSDFALAPQYAPGTLVIKGVEGYIVGRLGYGKRGTVRVVVAVLVGGAEMVAGYFLYETFALNLGVVSAGAEVPFNILQAVVGLVVAVPLASSVNRVSSGKAREQGTKTA